MRIEILIQNGANIKRYTAKTIERALDILEEAIFWNGNEYGAVLVNGEIYSEMES